MGDDIGSGLLHMAICFDFCSTNVVQLSNWNPYFYRFRCHHPLITQLNRNLKLGIHWMNWISLLRTFLGFFCDLYLQFIAPISLWNNCIDLRLFLKCKEGPFLKLQPQNFVIISESLAAKLNSVRQTSVNMTNGSKVLIYLTLIPFFCINYKSNF